MRDRGAIAQLGERLDRTQEVGGSSPPSSIPICRCFSKAAERPPFACNPSATRRVHMRERCEATETEGLDLAPLRLRVGCDRGTRESPESSKMPCRGHDEFRAQKRAEDHVDARRAGRPCVRAIASAIWYVDPCRLHAATRAFLSTSVLELLRDHRLAEVSRPRPRPAHWLRESAEAARNVEAASARKGRVRRTRGYRRSSWGDPRGTRTGARGPGGPPRPPVASFAGPPTHRNTIPGLCGSEQRPSAQKLHATILSIGPARSTPPPHPWSECSACGG